jgi:CheY-like chemotaxis protein
MPNANTILIVDDDPDIHHLLAAALRDEDYLIEDRYDGREALSFLEAQCCDLVITDVRMPGSMVSSCFAESARYNRVQKFL